MTNIHASGIAPGQRRLNGPQTTGREYRNLSQPTHSMVEEHDIPAPMRDGVNLLADVYRPSEAGRYPALIAASPYRVRFRTWVRLQVSSKPVQVISSFQEVTFT